MVLTSILLARPRLGASSCQGWMPSRTWRYFLSMNLGIRNIRIGKKANRRRGKIILM